MENTIEEEGRKERRKEGKGEKRKKRGKAKRKLTTPFLSFFSTNVQN